MSDPAITGLLVVTLFLLLGSGVWIGLALAGVAWIGMELFSSRPAGDAMAVTIWGTASSWTLTALPLFVWMGEILFRTRLSDDMFRGLAPWLERLPGRLLHTNIIGCTIFAAVSGSSAATCATIGKMTLPELKARGYPEGMTIGTLCLVQLFTGVLLDSRYDPGIVRHFPVAVAYPIVYWMLQSLITAYATPIGLFGWLKHGSVTLWKTQR